MTHFLSVTHRELESVYGTHAVGALDELHPMAKKMIEECAPHQNGSDSRYQEFLTFLSDDLMREASPAKIDLIKEKIKPEDFSEYMNAFALGLQFAARKAGGNIKPIHYRFAHTLTSNGNAFRSFEAAVQIDDDGTVELLINPAFIADYILTPSNEKFIKNGNNLNAKEMVTLLAIEEMMHIYQVQSGKRPIYTLEKFDPEHYYKDPLEKEADILQDVAMRELRLGSQYRGLRR